MILINHASSPIRKERLSPTSKAKRETSRNKFVEKGGVPGGVKSCGEINSSDNRKRDRLGFVKLVRNELRKEQNLIKSRPYRAETALAGTENGIRLHKEE